MPTAAAVPVQILGQCPFGPHRAVRARRGDPLWLPWLAMPNTDGLQRGGQARGPAPTGIQMAHPCQDVFTDSVLASVPGGNVKPGGPGEGLRRRMLAVARGTGAPAIPMHRLRLPHDCSVSLAGRRRLLCTFGYGARTGAPRRPCTGRCGLIHSR